MGFLQKQNLKNAILKKAEVIAKPKNPLFGKRAMSKRDLAKNRLVDNLGT